MTAARSAPFAVGDRVLHLKKRDVHVVERVPGQVLVQIDDVWVPGYRYRREGDDAAGEGPELVRTQEDFERSFSRA